MAPARNVGIVAMEVYFPSICIDQRELELFDGVSPGKYTVGLGQDRMGFCSDREDVCSISLTVVHNLVERYQIDPKSVGRLDVGTETIIDKSKSVKSVLMRLFAEHGNFDVEGADNHNACYGGTAALFNAVSWMESSYWDGRYALVVSADIAVYAAGPARCTGGAGAVAMLLGPDAPLVLEQGLRACYSDDTFDFAKPVLNSEYPVVNGKLSVRCYLSALDSCYQSFCRRAEALGLSSGSPFSLRDISHFLFHSPFSRLVEKSLARLLVHDCAKDLLASDVGIDESSFHQLRASSLVRTLEDPEYLSQVDAQATKISRPLFSKKTEASLLLSRNVGNMYCASLYGGLVSLLVGVPTESLLGKRIALFSYGSGCVASMFSLRVTDTDASTHSLGRIVENLSQVPTRLQGRCRVSPSGYIDCLRLREELICGDLPYNPKGPIDHSSLWPSTYYLDCIDADHHRHYRRKCHANGFHADRD